MVRPSWDNSPRERTWITKDQAVLGITCQLQAVCHHQRLSWTWTRWTSSKMVWWCQIKWDSQTNKCSVCPEWTLTSLTKCSTTRLPNLKMETSSSLRWCQEATNSCKWINLWTICKDTETCQAWTLVNRIQFHLNSTKLSRCQMALYKMLTALFN